MGIIHLEDVKEIILQLKADEVENKNNIIEKGKINKRKQASFHKSEMAEINLTETVKYLNAKIKERDKLLKQGKL